MSIFNRHTEQSKQTTKGRFLNGTAILVATFGHIATVLAQYPTGYESGQQAQTAIQYQSPDAKQPIQQVQITSDPRRPLDQRIEAMPKSQQKLQVIHNRSQLVITRGKIRRMAWSDPSIIDVVQFSPTEISILGLGLGTTDLWLWFEDQDEPLMYVLTVIRDPDLEEQRRIDYGRIERRIALLYPNSKVYLIPMSYKIIVRGQAGDAQQAANIMQIVRGEVIAQEGNGFNGNGNNGGIGNGGNGGFNNDPNNNFGGGNTLSSLIVDELQVPGEFQVMIRVRIAELNRSQLRRMGIDWAVLFDDGAQAIGQTLTGGAAVLTGIFEAGDILIMVDALASNGTAKILEDAQLVTLSGEPAAFLSGGEFAVPTIVGIGGAQGQQTSFRGFGTSIIATPTVVDDDLIRLQIVPELSAINGGNAVGGIPGLNVKRVQTRVELREGQTIVLGGLFSRQESTEVTRIPFLGEIPIIGNFIFNAKQASEDETEMLIIVTPEIVRPMDAEQVPPLPGFYVTHPDDIDFYKFNRTEGNPDLSHYHLLPYGNGQGYGENAGYNFYNPAQAGGLSPQPAGGGYSAPMMPGAQPGYGPQMGYPQQQIGYPQQQMQPIPMGMPMGQNQYQQQPQQQQYSQQNQYQHGYQGGQPPQQQPIQQASGVRVNPQATNYR